MGIGLTEIIEVMVKSTVFGFFLGTLTRFIWMGVHKVFYMISDVSK
jgi:hypothetical protein